MQWKRFDVVSAGCIIVDAIGVNIKCRRKQNNVVNNMCYWQKFPKRLRQNDMSWQAVDAWILQLLNCTPAANIKSPCVKQWIKVYIEISSIYRSREKSNSLPLYVYAQTSIFRICDLWSHSAFSNVYPENQYLCMRKQFCILYIYIFLYTLNDFILSTYFHNVYCAWPFQSNQSR